MTAASWEDLLADASTPDEVISIVRDFMAGIDHNDIARLPERCQPGNLLGMDDVLACAYELVRYQHECDPDADQSLAHLANGLASFFSRASVRLSELTTPKPSSKLLARLFTPRT